MKIVGVLIQTKIISIPGLKLGKQAEYLCTDTILKAHARVYHIYNDEFRANQKGQIGIVFNAFHYYSKNKDDVISNRVAYQYAFGRFAHPIFSKNGDYADIIKRRIDENCKFEGLQRSRLPLLSDEWIHYIKYVYYLEIKEFTLKIYVKSIKVNRRFKNPMIVKIIAILSVEKFCTHHFQILYARFGLLCSQKHCSVNFSFRAQKDCDGNTFVLNKIELILSRTSR